MRQSIRVADITLTIVQNKGSLGVVLSGPIARGVVRRQGVSVGVFLDIGGLNLYSANPFYALYRHIQHTRLVKSTATSINAALAHCY